MRNRARSAALAAILCGATALPLGLAANAAAVGTPSAQNVSAAGSGGQPITVTLRATDDTDLILNFSIVTNPSQGSLGPVSSPSCQGNGAGGVACTATATYASTSPNLSGSDSFTYKATTSPGGVDSNLATASVAVFTPGSTAMNSIDVPPGTTGSVAVPGVSASLTAAPTDPGALTFVAAAYPPSNPLFGASLPPGSVVAAFDLRAINATGLDKAFVTFTYPDPGDGSTPQLFFFDPSTGTPVRVSGSTLAPGSFVVDRARHTITVTFDGTSFPKLANLTGTRFSITHPPRISHLAISRCSARSRASPKVRIRFLLSQSARVSFKVERRKGSALRRACPRRGEQPGRRRSRFSPSKSAAVTLAAGRHSVALPLGNARPGGYRVTLTATNTAGTSVSKRRRFVVLGG